MAPPGRGGSYYEDYMQSRSIEKHCNDSKSTRNLLTDRNAYLSYLEIQLEKVSAACLNTEGFDTRLKGMSRAVSSVEEKVAHVMKIAKMTQTFTEEETAKVANATTRSSDKLSLLQEELSKAYDDNKRLYDRLDRVETSLRECELRLANDAQNSRTKAHESHQRLEGRIESISTSVAVQESRLGQIDSAILENKNNASIQESRIKELITSEINKQAAASDRRYEDVLSQLQVLKDRVAEDSRKSAKHASIELSRVHVNVEEQIESLKSSIETIVGTQTQMQGQIQSQNRTNIDAQNMLSQNIIAMQQDISTQQQTLASRIYNTPTPVSSNTGVINGQELQRVLNEEIQSVRKRVESSEALRNADYQKLREAIDFVKSSSETQESAMTKLRTEIMSRNSSTEDSCKAVVRESIASSAAQAQKLIDALAKVESRVAAELAARPALSKDLQTQVQELRELTENRFCEMQYRIVATEGLGSSNSTGESSAALLSLRKELLNQMTLLQNKLTTERQSELSAIRTSVSEIKNDVSIALEKVSSASSHYNETSLKLSSEVAATKALQLQTQEVLKNATSNHSADLLMEQQQLQGVPPVLSITQPHEKNNTTTSHLERLFPAENVVVAAAEVKKKKTVKRRSSVSSNKSSKSNASAKGATRRSSSVITSSTKKQPVKTVKKRASTTTTRRKSQEEKPEGALTESVRQYRLSQLYAQVASLEENSQSPTTTTHGPPTILF